MEKRGFFSRHTTFITQLIVWIVLLSMPILTMWGTNMEFDWEVVLGWLVPIAVWMLIFYLNYLLYIPRILFRHKTWKFVGVNLLTSLAVIAVTITIEFIQDNSLTFNSGILVAMLMLLVTFLFLTLAAISIRSLQRNKQLEEEREHSLREQSEMELARLKSQLNPHFLFNSLNNISALSAIDTEGAQQAIETLSSMLRYVLYDTAAPTVPLDSELRFLRDYISLMSLRYTDMLRVDLQTDPLLPGDTLTPPMLFISLVENAFKYGANSTRDSEIKIDIRRAGDKLTMRVTNTLLTPSVSAPADKVRPEKHGVGLRNLRRRLEILFPGDHTLSYGPNPDGLYEAIISIPLHYAG